MPPVRARAKQTTPRLPRWQVGGAALRECTYSSAARQLAVRDITSLPSFRQLLAALQPAGTPLLQLVISGPEFGSAGLQPLLRSPGALNGCSQLASLTSLDLHHMGWAADPLLFDTALRALLQQAPRLAALKLRGCTCVAEAFPATITSRAGLQHLSLHSCSLQQLP